MLVAAVLTRRSGTLRLGEAARPLLRIPVLAALTALALFVGAHFDGRDVLLP